MKNTVLNTAELMLEMNHTNGTRKLYRTVSPSGEVHFVEVSDIIDFSRPLTENLESYPLYISLASAWKATVNYLSAEGLLARQVWHEDLHEWATFAPVYIHPEMRELIYADVSALISELSLSQIGAQPQLPLWLHMVGRLPYISEQSHPQLARQAA